MAVSSKYFVPVSCFIMLLVCCMAGCTKDSASTQSAVFGGKGGSTARFAINGDWLYTVDATRLRTYSLANPGNPQLTQTQDVGFEIETIFPFAGKLFIGSTSVVHIFSIDDPAKPQKLSIAISPTVMRRCDPVVAKDTVAFATLRAGAACGGFQSILAVYDIRDIKNPVQRASMVLNEPRGLGYADTVLYVCDPPGLRLLNIKDAYRPSFIGELRDGDYYDVIPYGSLLFAQTRTGGIIYDITKPAAPVKLSLVQ